MSTTISIHGGIDDDELFRDDLEDALRGLLGPAGRLIGAGFGMGENDGFSVDLALADGEDVESWVGRLAELLPRLGAGPRTYFDIYPSGWKPGMRYRRIKVSGEDQWLTQDED